MLGSSHNAKQNIESLEFVVNELDKPANMRKIGNVDTESNLTSRVFANIATSIDIPIMPYETGFKLIVESLVKRRNRVAHGQYLDLSPGDFDNLAEDVIQLLRNYKTDIENAASQACYKRDAKQMT
ncbi:MAG: hypothetical protein FJX63_06570 [Alphaproteobacteria bacterium]|nr:hypothetical protein [Alphaproteobacteria bacterium]